MSHKTLRTTVVASVILLVGAATAVAEGEFKCDEKKSLGDCYTAVFDQREKEAREKAEGMTVAAAAEGVVDKAAAADGPGTFSSLVDFLPSFLGNLGIDGLSDTDGNLTFDRIITAGEYWRIGLGATAFTDPEIFEPLKMALPEAIRDDRAKTLSEDIGDFDKVDYRLSVSREDDQGEFRFGRDVKDYDDLFSMWKKQIIDIVVKKKNKTPFTAWVDQPDIKKEMQAYEDAGGENPLTSPISELVAKLDKKRVEQLEKGIVKAAEGMVLLMADIDKATGQIDDLIANQPQLYLKVNFQVRDEVTGPDELSGKFVYEMGMSGNVNDFMTWAKNHQNQCTGNTSAYPGYACMLKYLKQKPKAADNGNRLAISVEYATADALDFKLPDDNFTFQLDKTEKWIGSLSYGRYFPNFSFLTLNPRDGSDVEDGTRFDLEAKYEDVSGDPMRQARFVATATFSQRMARKTLFSISAVYANKPEYLGEVDEQFSARFGIKWKRNPDGDS